ncbi:hypothetical protein [Sphingobacterium paludis]|uniref:Uncharacterized protein n=1 Tax=Sphingobacterium paludis TaxID=1476465 RepID=A0A4R7CR79_9SPHI|nr:hypothetical protein [Sphingobacterium paludis]TDS05972.1 hypothetical protein B0I21_1186 [Sphingobacterium paludis]
MENHTTDALDKLSALKNIVIAAGQFDQPSESAFIWGTDPFYSIHRNVALELMHKGHLEDARKLFEDYVNYQYPERLEDARKDINRIWDGLIPLTRHNIEELYQKYNGVVVSSDIYFPMSYVNYTFINVSDREREMMLEDEYNTVVPLEWILAGDLNFDNVYLDVYNTKLNNGRYPFLKIKSLCR